MPTLEQTDAGIAMQTAMVARQQAHETLASLLEAKSATERAMAEAGRADALKAVTGRSSLDNAIASARRLIESFDRAIAALERDHNAHADGFLPARLRGPAS